MSKMPYFNNKFYKIRPSFNNKYKIHYLQNRLSAPSALNIGDLKFRIWPNCVFQAD